MVSWWAMAKSRSAGEKGLPAWKPLSSRCAHTLSHRSFQRDRAVVSSEFQSSVLFPCVQSDPVVSHAERCKEWGDIRAWYIEGGTAQLLRVTSRCQGGESSKQAVCPRESSGNSALGAQALTSLISLSTEASSKGSSRWLSRCWTSSLSTTW